MRLTAGGNINHFRKKTEGERAQETERQRECERTRELTVNKQTVLPLGLRKQNHEKAVSQSLSHVGHHMCTPGPGPEVPHETETRKNSFPLQDHVGHLETEPVSYTVL